MKAVELQSSLGTTSKTVKNTILERPETNLLHGFMSMNWRQNDTILSPSRPVKTVKDTNSTLKAWRPSTREQNVRENWMMLGMTQTDRQTGISNWTAYICQCSGRASYSTHKSKRLLIRPIACQAEATRLHLYSACPVQSNKSAPSINNRANSRRGRKDVSIFHKTVAQATLLRLVTKWLQSNSAIHRTYT